MSKEYNSALQARVEQFLKEKNCRALQQQTTNKTTIRSASGIERWL